MQQEQVPNNDLPRLYAMSSRGKIKTWKIAVRPTDTDAFDIITIHGFKDMKLKEDVRRITSGKNIGRSNETTIQGQALLEAQSKWNKKKDANYIESIPTEDSIPANIRPMLAHGYSSRGHNIVYPCYVQPKLNGVRCLASMSPDPTYLSRTGKKYSTLSHLDEWIERFAIPGLPFDGEIYVHGSLTFQDIIAGVKREKSTSELSKLLEYHVYDIADDSGIPFEERIEWIYKNLPKEDGIPIKRVTSYMVDSEEEMMEAHDNFVDQGYEGIIIRNLKGAYVFDNRSADLQKFKNFIDEEFDIIGGVEGSGKDAGCVVFRCKAANGLEFSCRPRGSQAHRKRMMIDLPSLIGEKLTVRYQNLSDDGVPIFPVGIAVRDYE